MSPTKAQKGSIDTLIEASNTHKIPAISQSVGELESWRVGELGIINNDKLAAMAPHKKYGRLLSERFHMLLLI